MPNLNTKPVETSDTAGLSGDEARSRLEKFGANVIPDVPTHPIRSVVGKFWAPIPCMLEAVIALELYLHNDVEALVIAVLLVFNASLSFFRETRAQAALLALRSRLALIA